MNLSKNGTIKISLKKIHLYKINKNVTGNIYSKSGQ